MTATLTMAEVERQIGALLLQLWATGKAVGILECQVAALTPPNPDAPTLVPLPPDAPPPEA